MARWLAPLLALLRLLAPLRRRRSRPAAPVPLDAGPPAADGAEEATPATSAEDVAAAPPATPAPLTLAGVLGLLPPGEHKLWHRIDEYCRTYGACTASNETLAKDWHGPGKPCDPRHVRRLLAQLRARGILLAYDDPRQATGRLLRTCAPTTPPPARQLELRLRDQRARPLAAHELTQGHADPPAPFVERRRTPPPPEQASGGHVRRTSMSGGHVPRTSSDLDLGSVVELPTSRDRDRREAEPEVERLDRGAAPAGATEAPVYPLEERRRYRQRAAERRSRWVEAFLPKEEHRLPIEVCRQLLDAIPERRQHDGAIIGYLYATLEEREMAAGRLPLPAPARPPTPAPAHEAAADPGPSPPPPPPEPAAAALWERLQPRLEALVSENTLMLWFRLLRPVRLGKDGLWLWAPEPSVRDHVRRRFGALLEQALAEDCVCAVHWLVPEEPPTEASA